MATGQGMVTIDFGNGTHEASITFADAAIVGTSNIEVYVMADSTTAMHTANDHRYLPLFAHFTAAPNAGVGGTIYGRAIEKLVGTFQLNYVWAD
jgi:hypothetical protein